MSSPLEALEISVDHLRAITETMDERQYVASAYPTEWTVADVMSHLGSAAVIFKRQLDDSIDERATPPKFNESVWDVWNAKTPHAQVTDSLDADRTLLQRFLEMSPHERDAFALNLGPVTFDFNQALTARLSEHVVHTWDIEESFNSEATLLLDAVPFIFANLDLLVRYTAKPTGNVHTLHIRTSNPTKEFALSQSSDSVTLDEVEGVDRFDVELPAEAFIRLAYGRLDEQHTPAGIDATHLDELRRVFQGI